MNDGAYIQIDLPTALCIAPELPEKMKYFIQAE